MNQDEQVMELMQSKLKDVPIRLRVFRNHLPLVNDHIGGVVQNGVKFAAEWRNLLNSVMTVAP